MDHLSGNNEMVNTKLAIVKSSPSTGLRDESQDSVAKDRQRRVDSNKAEARPSAGRAIDEATAFDLTGSHETLTCANCHPPGEKAARQSRACVSCHRSDDIHGGRFGQNCNRCHLTTTFEELKRDL